ncbi:MAG: hypothetical protein J2P30_00495 [Actinobacteria bacterium]|nr:hypothetical protein [Actinomycetota bacterium]
MLTMLDSVDIPELVWALENGHKPDALAGYVGGIFHTWPGIQQLAQRFLGLHLLSVAVNASQDAQCLDIEQGDATPAQAPGWVRRQHKRGIKRPVLYANASTMPEVWAELRNAGIPRSGYRLWSAHYTTEHICGPTTCAAPGVPAVDGTQFASSAWGHNIDRSLLHDSFFTTPKPPAPAPKPHLPEDYPMLLNKGQGAVTPVALPNDVKRHRFATNTQAKVRVDFLGVKDASENLTVGYSNSPDGCANPAGCKSVIIHRLDGGTNDVSYVPVT